MDDFEIRLKSVPLARPSPDMKTRIFGTGSSRPRLIDVFRRRIPLGWAALFALFAGLAGMFASQIWSRKAVAPPQPVVYVQIIRSPSDRNMFDFTVPAEDFMQGELTVNVQAPKEI